MLIYNHTIYHNIVLSRPTAHGSFIKKSILKSKTAKVKMVLMSIQSQWNYITDHTEVFYFDLRQLDHHLFSSSIYVGREVEQLHCLYVCERGILYDSPWSFRETPVKMQASEVDNPSIMWQGDENDWVLLKSLLIKEQPLSSSVRKLTSLVKKKRKRWGYRWSEKQTSTWFPTIRLNNSSMLYSFKEGWREIDIRERMKKKQCR